MANRTKGDAVYVATETFVCEMDGTQEWVRAGETRVRAGHPLLEVYRGYFAPVETAVHYEVEQATAAPGEKRGAPKPESEEPEASGPLKTSGTKTN